LAQRAQSRPASVGRCALVARIEQLHQIIELNGFCQVRVCR
jgi:hypothetical protein